MAGSSNHAADLARRWAATGRHVARSRGITDADVSAYWERLRAESPELLHAMLSERLATAFEGFADALDVIHDEDITADIDPTEVDAP